MNIEILILDEEDLGYKEDFYRELTELTFMHAGVEFEDAEISLVITDDEGIASANEEYRDKQGATDVLSFPLSDDGYNEGGMLGDIVISKDTALKQAENAGITADREVAFLFIHGLLHLLGYDHELGDEEEEEMFSMQERILETAVMRKICE